MTAVVTARQFDVRIVLENIHDPHNVSAILRSCDSVGIPKVSLLYNVEKFPRIGKKSSASANKWVERDKYTTVDDCYSALRNEGYTIYATNCNPEAVDFYSIDLTKKVAIVVGNEHRGVSDEGIEKADKSIFIPMHGMVQSLNVSVATAVILYEVLRQRREKGMYEKSALSPEEYKAVLDGYIKK